MSDLPPDIPLEPRRKTLLDKLSIVWLVPLAALAIALGVAWQAYVDRGPLIEISFENASGIKAGETELHYRDITVGMVEEVGFDDGLRNVVVRVRLDPQVAPFVDEDASFWVVQPRVTTRGVSGLDTVLSGVYLEGSWDAEPGTLQASFVGLADAPLVRNGQRSTRIVLRSMGDAGLAADTPITYRGVEVGTIGAPALADDGLSVAADAVIYAPYDRLITTSTLFWDAAGFTLSFGPRGADVDFTSLASLISGGVTFETIVTGGDPISDGTEFEVFADRASAESSVFNTNEAETLHLSVIFDQNVSGLSPDAPVELEGLRIGHVTSLTGIVDRERFGDGRVRLMANLSIDPQSFDLPGDETTVETLAYLERRVAAGLRARLASGSLLTGGLKIELALIDDAPIALVDLGAQPYPVFPSVRSELADIASRATGLFDRLGALPVEQLMVSAAQLLENTANLVSSDEMQRTPAELQGLLSDARGVIGSDEIQALPGQFGALMGEVQTASADLRALLATLQEANAANRLLAAVDAAGVAAGEIGGAVQELPALVTRVTALGDKLQVLPLSDLVAEMTAVAASADAVLGSEGLRTLPDALSPAVRELQGALADLRAENGAGRLLSAVDKVAVAAGQFGTSLEDLPGLLVEIEALAAKANALPLDELVENAARLVAAAGDVAGSDALRALPGELGTALGAIERLVTEFSAADSAAQLVSAADQVAVVAGQVGTAVDGLPALMTQIEALAARAGSLPLDTLSAEATALLSSAAGLLGSEAVQALPAELGGALAALEQILTQIARDDAPARLVAAVDAAALAADRIGTASAGLPTLLVEIEALAAKANALPLDGFVSQATSVMSSAGGVLDSDGARALPGELAAALGELQVLLAGLNEAEASARLLAAVDAAAAAADQLEASTVGLPDLMRDLQAMAARAADLPLDELVTELTALAGSATQVLDAEGSDALPAALVNALDQMSAILAEIDAGGLTENANRTLAAAGNAADAIAQSTDQLPGIVVRLNALLSQATATLAGFDTKSDFSRETLATLREVQAAADAATSLARALRRQPNSILIGR